MKQIFNERQNAGIWNDQKVLESPYGEWNLYRTNAKVFTKVTAHYDHKLRVLVVDCAAVSGMSDVIVSPVSWIEPERIVETVDTLAQAQRRAITIADSWIERVQDETPPPDERDDLVIIAEARELGTAVPYEDY